MSAQLISLLVVALLAVVLTLVLRRSRGPAVANDAGIAKLRQAFEETHQPDEDEPLCFVALEKRGMSFRQRFIGVTNRRWLVVDPAGTLQEVERQDEYKKYREDYFMRMFHDDQGFYQAKLTYPAFRGQKWRLYEEAQGFPAQRQQLKAMFSLVGFRWVT